MRYFDIEFCGSCLPESTSPTGDGLWEGFSYDPSAHYKKAVMESSAPIVKESSGSGFFNKIASVFKKDKKVKKETRRMEQECDEACLDEDENDEDDCKDVSNECLYNIDELIKEKEISPPIQSSAFQEQLSSIDPLL